MYQIADLRVRSFGSDSNSRKKIRLLKRLPFIMRWRVISVLVGVVVGSRIGFPLLNAFSVFGAVIVRMPETETTDVANFVLLGINYFEAFAKVRRISYFALIVLALGVVVNLTNKLNDNLVILFALVFTVVLYFWLKAISKDWRHLQWVRMAAIDTAFVLVGVAFHFIPDSTDITTLECLFSIIVEAFTLVQDLYPVSHFGLVAVMIAIFLEGATKVNNNLMLPIAVVVTVVLVSSRAFLFPNEGPHNSPVVELELESKDWRRLQWVRKAAINSAFVLVGVAFQFMPDTTDVRILVLLAAVTFEAFAIVKLLYPFSHVGLVVVAIRVVLEVATKVNNKLALPFAVVFSVVLIFGRAFFIQKDGPQNSPVLELKRESEDWRRLQWVRNPAIDTALFLVGVAFHFIPDTTDVPILVLLAVVTFEAFAIVKLLYHLSHVKLVAVAIAVVFEVATKINNKLVISFAVVFSVVLILGKAFFLQKEGPQNSPVLELELNEV